jgi:hypothetical protein
MGISFFSSFNGLLLTFRFFSLRVVFAEKGMDGGAASFIVMSRSGVARCVLGRAVAATIGFGASSSLGTSGDWSAVGDESDVE